MRLAMRFNMSQGSIIGRWEAEQLTKNIKSDCNLATTLVSRVSGLNMPPQQLGCHGSDAVVTPLDIIRRANKAANPGRGLVGHITFAGRKCPPSCHCK